MSKMFDINCDMGEGFGVWSLADDEALMKLISSANIACGFHAGDPGIMRRTVELCLEHDVAIGSHPGFPDLLGFGRRKLALRPDEAADYITYQTGALMGFVDALGGRLHHVKAHGAFFALLRDDDSLAVAAAEAVARCGEDVLVYWPAPADGVAFCTELERRGVRVVPEVYTDLKYTAQGRLIIEPRKQWTDPEYSESQVRRYLGEGLVGTEAGTGVSMAGCGSFCVHSDGPNAVEVATRVRETTMSLGVDIAAP